MSKECLKQIRLDAEVLSEREALAEIMKKEALNEADYSGPCFVCDSNREYGEMLADAVEQAFPQLKGRIKKFSFGCAIGTHVGPDAAALFFVGKKRIE